MFWCSSVYLVVGLTCAVYYKVIPAEVIQLVWLLVLALPFLVPPIGRYFNMNVEWDRKMFDWLKGKDKMPKNVVPFPAPKAVPDNPYPPEEPKKPAVTYYTLGMTSENRLELKMGYSAITMNHGGVTNLINQLEVFRDQLAQYEGIEDV